MLRLPMTATAYARGFFVGAEPATTASLSVRYLSHSFRERFMWSSSAFARVTSAALTGAEAVVVVASAMASGSPSS